MATPGRKVLLRIPNAKASRLNKDNSTWTFLALGDFTVYEVAQAQAPSPSTRAPGPFSARPGGSSTLNSPISPGANSLPPPSPSHAFRSRTPPLPTSAPLTTTASGSSLVFAVRTAEFPLSQSTSVYFEAPNSYIIDNGEGFTVKVELELPRDGSHEILDNIIRKYVQSPAVSRSATPEMRMQDFRNQLVLMDENGRVLGPLNTQGEIKVDPAVTAGHQPGQVVDSEPVIVSFPSQEGAAAGQQIQISPFDDLRKDFGKSTSRVIGAAEYVSKGILFAAEYGANTVSTAAKDYTKRTQATDTPLVFSDTTKANVARVAAGTEHALRFTRSTIGWIANKAEQFGGTAVRYSSQELKNMGVIPDRPGPPDPNSKMTQAKGFFKDAVKGVLTVIESAEQGGKHFLREGRESSNTVVQHRFGDEARDLSNQITSAGTNVVLVYVDARGVAQRALLKRLGKGAIKARMADGREVVLDDSGLENQHTERDAQGNLLVVDESQGRVINASNVGTGYNGHSSAVEADELEGHAGLQHRHKPPPPPVPRRDYA